MKKTLALLMCIIISFSLLAYPSNITKSAEPESKIPAFPGAEGGGMYTTGGRGGDIYEVTNLNDSGAGSLREGVKKSNVTIVFRVSGIIELKNNLGITGSNITIAGQTAPGDGICIKNYQTGIAGKNVIIRYVRFRPGDEAKNEGDAITGRATSNIIIDHCSMSWGTDETCTFYRNRNITVQWSIISESLNMSVHFKGAHGYGGGWGGDDATLHHNIIAFHSSRNPRIDWAEEGAPPNNVDVRNNVIYNWYVNSAYGAEKQTNVNFINNYYKYGPNTTEDKRARIFDTIDPAARVYINGNYVDGYPDVTADNWKGVNSIPGDEVKLSEPVKVSDITTQSAQDAYNLVLDKAGAILPKRDSVDSRVVNEIKDGTGRLINSQTEVNSWPEYKSGEVPADSDHDGMPDEWEKSNGLDSNNKEDGKIAGSDGYTNVEKYLNSLSGDTSSKPQIQITNLKTNDMFKADKDIVIKTNTIKGTGNIIKVEFFNGKNKIGETSKAPYDFTWKNAPDGTYFMMARVFDDKGLSTDSGVIIIHVNSASSISPWTSKDIGKIDLKGTAFLKDGVMTVKGNGNIDGKNDTFNYVYQKLSGDGEIVAKVESMTKWITGLKGGVMIRKTLDTDSPFTMMELTYDNGEDSFVAGEFLSRTQKGADVDKKRVKNRAIPNWVKLARHEDTITGYYSVDGSNWTEVGNMKMSGDVYIGLAVDSANENNTIRNYNTVTFSNLSTSNTTPVSEKSGLTINYTIIAIAAVILAITLLIVLIALKKRKR